MNILSTSKNSIELNSSSVNNVDIQILWNNSLNVNIQIPNSILFEYSNDIFFFNGKQGQITFPFFDYNKDNAFTIKTSRSSSSINIITTDIKKKPRLQSLLSILTNSIKYIQQTSVQTLSLIGTGFKAEIINKNILRLRVGYSNAIDYFFNNDSIQIIVLESKYIYILGINNQTVNDIAAQIIAIKPPNPYDGKGIQYLNQNFIIKKKGKKE